MARLAIATIAAAVVAAAASVAGFAEAGSAGTLGSCHIGQMRLRMGPLVSEKTEQHTASVELTSIASDACTLDGYPVITLLDGRRTLLPFTYSHRGDLMISAARPAAVIVKAAGSAFFAFNKNACINFTTRIARTLRIAFPGSRVTQSILLPRYPIIDYCRDDPGGHVAVSPIVPRLALAFCRRQNSCTRRFE
jgi:Protein of unknown function (DUF4232)